MDKWRHLGLPPLAVTLLIGAAMPAGAATRQTCTLRPSAITRAPLGDAATQGWRVLSRVSCKRKEKGAHIFVNRLVIIDASGAKKVRPYSGSQMTRRTTIVDDVGACSQLQQDVAQGARSIAIRASYRRFSRNWQTARDLKRKDSASVAIADICPELTSSS